MEITINNNIMKRIFTLMAIVVVTLLSATTLSARELNVVPEPTYVDLDAEGDYLVTAKTRIIVIDEMWNPAQRFAEDMIPLFGDSKPMRITKHGNKGIKVRTESCIPAEGYEMTISEEGILISLIKPQFEAGRGAVGKGGIVRRREDRQAAVRRVLECAAAVGLTCTGFTVSPITGGDGNIEYLALFRRAAEGHSAIDDRTVRAVTEITKIGGERDK